MINSLRRVRALVRHYYLQVFYSLSRLYEHVIGWIRFMRWLPTLLRKLPQLRANTGSSGKRPGMAEVGSRPKLPLRYINLDYRQDRRAEVECEMLKLAFVEARRFSAINHPIGLVGAAQSHVAVLEEFVKKSDAAFMVCEDDIEFLTDPVDVEHLIIEFLEHPALDVLCLSYRLRGPKLPISSTLAIGNNIQTAPCYVVKASAAPALIANFSESVKLLLAGEPPSRAAFDIKWKELQSGELIFAIPRNNLARQRKSYSDNAGQVKEYRP